MSESQSLFLGTYPPSPGFGLGDPQGRIGWTDAMCTVQDQLLWLQLNTHQRAPCPKPVVSGALTFFVVFLCRHHLVGLHLPRLGECQKMMSHCSYMEIKCRYSTDAGPEKTVSDNLGRVDFLSGKEISSVTCPTG